MHITIVPVGMLGTNCYLLESEAKGCAVIDPGAQPDKIIQIIEKAGLSPRLILLTHGHFDHIGGVSRLAARFPEAKLCIGGGDAGMLLKDPRAFPGVGQDAFPIPEPEALEDGQMLTLDEISIEVLDTPGHTPGGVCYRCGDILFSGDTLFRGDCGRCDLEGGDYELMKRSLRRLAELPGDYTVYPGHGESTTMEAERARNIYMAEARG